MNNNDVVAMRAINDAIKKRSLSGLAEAIQNHENYLTARTHLNAGGWLHVVAYGGWIDGARLLLRKGVPITDADRDGAMAIAAAADGGHSEMVEFLLEAGSPIDQSDQVKDPLFCAIVGRSPRAIKILLNAGANPLIEHKGNQLTLNSIGFARYIGEEEIADFITQSVEESADKSA